MPYRPSRLPFLPSMPVVVLIALLAVLTVAGGASRGDVFGQVVVRAAAALALVTMLLFADRPAEGLPRPVSALLFAALALVAVQLLPLPPGLWRSLPARDIFPADLIGADVWRPLSIEPGATANAAASLLIPGAVAVLAAGVGQRGMEMVFRTLLVLISLSAVVGVLQLAGRPAANPLVNDIPGAISGLFANRNHFALFLAMGCLLAPVWAVLAHAGGGWRAAIAIGLIAFFLLLIVAGGSRAGLGLGIVATVIGILMVRREAARALARLPRWGRWPLIIGVPAAGVTLAFLATQYGRTRSVDRLLALNAGDDMRSLALPTMLDIARHWYAVGSGLGSFDTLFRIYEPFDLLDLTYFNHAHDDSLEVLLTGGLPAVLLLVTAVGWWIVASVRVWRGSERGRNLLAKLGSALILLVALASVFDYPARTPLMMAIVVLAAVWLGRGVARVGAALPIERRHL